MELRAIWACYLDNDATAIKPVQNDNLHLRNTDTDKIDTYSVWLTDSRCDTFKAGFVNAASIKRHFKQFGQLLVDDPTYHVMGVAESRFGDVVDDGIIAIEGYSLIRQDQNTQGGGVVL